MIGGLLAVVNFLQIGVVAVISENVLAEGGRRSARQQTQEEERGEGRGGEFEHRLSQTPVALQRG